MKISKSIFFIIPVLVIGLLYWANSQQIKNNLTVSGTVQANEVRFGSRQSGRVEKVFVEEGQTLKRGQIILSLKAEEMQSQIEAIKANIQAQKAYILELENGNRPEQISLAKANYQKAKAEYELNLNGYQKEEISSVKASMERATAEFTRASQNANRRENLFKEELISKDQLEIAQNQLKVAQKNLEEAKQNYQKILKGYRKEEIQKSLYSMQAQEANYKDLLNGTRPEKLASEKQKLVFYNAQLSELQSKADELNIISPCDCELSEFELEEGSLILSNQVVGTLVNLNDLFITAYLPQEAYGLVKQGDIVKISSLSYPNEKLIGHIKFISLKAEFTPRNIQTIEGRKQEVFKVKVNLDNTHKLFRPGMDLDLQFNFKKKGKLNK